MTEKTKVEKYLEHLDQILDGKRVSGIVEDDEVRELLMAAKKLIDVDFSVKSMVRESLRSKLVSILLSQEDQTSGLSSEGILLDEDELFEEELSMAAAGSPESDWKGACSIYSECPFRSCTSDCIFRKK